MLSDEKHQHKVDSNRSSRDNSRFASILHCVHAIWASFGHKSRDIAGRKNPRCPEQQLESTVDPSADSLLPPNLQLSRKPENGDTSWRNQNGAGRASIATTHATTPIKWRAPIMSVVTLQPRYYIKVLVDVHVKVLAIISNVSIHIEAEHPVNVFVVDDEGLRAFESGQPSYPVYYTQQGISALTTSLNLRIPQGQVAWVVIQGVVQPYTAVHYEVS